MYFFGLVSYTVFRIYSVTMHFGQAEWAPLTHCSYLHAGPALTAALTVSQCTEWMWVRWSNVYSFRGCYDHDA